MATAAPVEEFERECTICHEQFMNPKILPCGHLLCRHCLISWLRKKCKAGCPLCRHRIIHGRLSSRLRDVADSFPTHFFMMAIIEADRLLSGQHNCCVCEDVAAVSLCVSCGDKFCEKCSTMHKKQSMSKHHQVETLASLTAVTLAAKLPVKCHVHTSEEAEVFCRTHSISICIVCASASHRPCLLVVKTQNKGQDSSCDLLNQAAATLKTKVQTQKRALAEAEEFLQNVSRQTDAGMAEISALEQRLEKAVQACCSRLKETVLEKSSNIQTKVLGQKTQLMKEQERTLTHAHIMDQLQSLCFSLHGNFSNMVEEMKTRADTFDGGDDVLEYMKVNQEGLGMIVDAKAVKRMEQELTIMSTKEEEELRFHANHGKKIRLSKDDQAAVRTDKKTDNGIVVSRDAMVVNRLYEVHVDAINTDYKETYLGVVTEDPENMRLPKSAIGSPSAQILCVWGEYVQVFDKKLEKAWPCLEDVPQGTRLGLSLDQNYNLHLYVQGQDKGVVWSKLPQPCYFMFDLFSRCVKVTAQPVKVVQGT